MNAKTLMTTALAGLFATAAHAITSDEIAAALDVDPSVGTFSCSGVSDWQLDESTTHAGSAAVRSGSVNAPDSNWKNSLLTMTVSCKEASRMSFWIKTSCYNSTSYAKLVVTVDGSSYTYTGSTDWTKITSILIPGVHEIKCEYSKRYNYNSGSDCAWVDQISFDPILPTPTAVEVTNIKCTQRYPWNGMVDIDYTVKCEKADADVWVYPVGYDKDSNTTMAPRSLTGDGVNAPVKAGTHRMTWKVTDDYPDFNSTAFTVKMTALVGAAPYMVVDLSGGVDALSYPVSYLSSVPEGGWGDEYKTTKLVLRLIPPGSFMMGSPSDEYGRDSYEDLHGVVLTKPFYIGVFECTQKQYELVMGSNPANYKGDMRPVQYVSYNNIRGSANGAGWPTHNQVDANSFMGRLRSKVNMLFDLPTEAQWEYACRAGTSTSLNSGKNYDWGVNCNEVARWGRNAYNSGTDYKYDGKGGYTYYTVVGCYLENAWGLYDMHGNVCEMCRDFWNYGLGAAGVIDPVGASRGYSSGDERSYRGGYCTSSSDMRSAYRYGKMRAGNTSEAVGFRVYCSPVAQ